MSNVMCTRVTFFGLFYVVLLCWYSFHEGVATINVRGAVGILAPRGGCALGLSERPEQPREAEPCGQRGSRVSRPCWVTVAVVAMALGRCPDTPSPAAPAALQDKELRAAAARQLPSSSTKATMVRSPGLRGTSWASPVHTKAVAESRQVSTAQAVAAAVSVPAAVARVPV